MNQVIGLGDSQAPLTVYIANRPPLPEFQNLATVRPLVSGEIANIVNQTGNHWRKIFNLYAKLAFALDTIQRVNTWQEYRDEFLLQADSGQRLLFSRPPDVLDSNIHIVMGKGYAEALGITDLNWLDRDFAVRQNLIVCPYFDYRQLSNVKLERLVELVG